MRRYGAGWRVRRLLLAASVCLCCLGADSGYDRERQLGRQLTKTVEQGEPLWLEAGGREFLALHAAVLGRLPRRALVLVHGMGGHPDWPEVIAPLRVGLPQRGWSTLSTQMPLLPPRALADDYGTTLKTAVRRIDRAVEYLRAQGYACVVLAGYGFGASQALAWLADGGKADGLVTISILAREYLQPAVDLPSLLGSIDIPVLDIYGRNDYPEIVDSAHERRIAVTRNNNTAYEQRVIHGAGHYYTEREQRLIEVIAEWLDRQFGDHACGQGATAAGTDRTNGGSARPSQQPARD